MFTGVLWLVHWSLLDINPHTPTQTKPTSAPKPSPNEGVSGKIHVKEGNGSFILSSLEMSLSIMHLLCISLLSHFLVKIDILCINSSFHRSSPGRNNHNASKLIEKYTNLAREALSNGDKMLSENYHQHADHFLRISLEQNIEKNDKNHENINSFSEDKKTEILSQEEIIQEKQENKTEIVK